jgi:hypothetical protein
MSTLAMISRCAKHQPDDAAVARAKELEPVVSREAPPDCSGEYLPEVPLPEEEITP